MTGRRPEVSSLPDPDFCHYATRIFLPLLFQLEAELQGVVRDDDIEYVHRSRVATRRIRAAFTLFSSCFQKQILRANSREIRRLTRSLGEARDLDVQIGFIRSFLEEKSHSKNHTCGYFSPLTLSCRKDSIQEETAITVTEKPEISQSISLFSRFSHWLANHNHIRTEKPLLISLDPTQSSPDIGATDGIAVYAGLECLLLRMVQQRRVLQPEVTTTVNEFLEKGVIQELSRYLHDLKVRSLLEGTGNNSIYSYEQAFIQITVQVSDLFWFEPYLDDSSLIHQHHEMRIAAKRLRYTLEAFADLFEDHLKTEIRSVKKIQEFLGDIHDADVWIENLPAFLIEEEERSIAYFGNDRFFGSIRPGILALMDNRKERRGALFDEFCRYWERLKKEGFWDLLSEKIAIPVQSAFSGSMNRLVSGPISIAVISDVHANLPALEAVLADAEERGVMVVLNAGDTVGYGPFPNEVVSLIRSRHILSVMGKL